MLIGLIRKDRAAPSRAEQLIRTNRFDPRVGKGNCSRLKRMLNK